MTSHITPRTETATHAHNAHHEIDARTEREYRPPQKPKRKAAGNEAPIVFDQITISGTQYAITPPLIFKVKFHQKEQIYTLKGPFDIHLAEFTRDQLHAGIQMFLEHDWQYLVEEPDITRLSADAMRHRQRLQKRLQRVT